jgi:hypothetical protein
MVASSSGGGGGTTTTTTTTKLRNNCPAMQQQTARDKNAQALDLPCKRCTGHGHQPLDDPLHHRVLPRLVVARELKQEPRHRVELLLRGRVQ